MHHTTRRERHSTLAHRIALVIMRSATYAGPAPLQAPGLPYAAEPRACPRCGARRQVNVDGASVHAHLGRTLCDDGYPGPDSTEDEIRTWAHVCTRYTPDGYPYVPRTAHFLADGSCTR